MTHFNLYLCISLIQKQTHAFDTQIYEGVLIDALVCPGIGRWSDDWRKHSPESKQKENGKFRSTNILYMSKTSVSCLEIPVVLLNIYEEILEKSYKIHYFDKMSI